MIKFRINFVISLISMAHVHNVCLDREISGYQYIDRISNEKYIDRFFDKQIYF